MGKKSKSRSKNKKRGTSTNHSNVKTSEESNEPPVVVENNDTVPVAVVEETNGNTTPATNENAPEPTVVENSKPQPKKSHVPEAVEKSLSLFSIPQQILIRLLCSPILNQAHLFDSWADPNTTDEMKKQLVSQLDDLNSSYPGSLAAYISNARKLLEDSKKGVNPLEGWKPTVPTGQAFEIGTKEYDSVEAVGLKELGSVGFVLVAGGLGERLGYSDIKIGLPTEMATETMYIQYYIEYILSLQKKYGRGKKLPLCIMTSGDTNAGTVKLLKDNNYFGMHPDQITLVQQGQGVPALWDNNAMIVLESPSQISTKPHGHGDVHSLLYTNQVAKKWVKNGIEWIAFFQDTNGLAFHTLPLALGVSKKFDLVMNSLAVPRKAKQAIGGISKLVNSKGEERTINVEYNMLDPLLRATGNPEGDVNDEATGFSPFPGNINQLLFQAKPYADTLERTKGVMPEFVNPKYTDETKTVFKKPTRLECMMQDFPTVLEGKDTERVGFTSITADLCFSPVKNATFDGAALQKKGSPPGVAATGEADQYSAFRTILRSIGCQVADAQPATFLDITIVPGPQIVLTPDFVCCPAEYKTAFPTPEKVQISARSSLVVKGSGVVIESLYLDGALVIECEQGATGVIRDLDVFNAGWVLDPVASTANEIIAMRGYKIAKNETKHIVFKKDGTIDGDYDPDAVAKASSIPEKKKAVVSSKPVAVPTVATTTTATKSIAPSELAAPAVAPSTATETTSDYDPDAFAKASSIPEKEKAVVSSKPVAVPTVATTKTETKSIAPSALAAPAVAPSTATETTSDSRGAPDLSKPDSSEVSKGNDECSCIIL